MFRDDYMPTGFKFLFRLTLTFIVIVWIAIIAFWIFVGTAAFKTAGQVEERGLKAVIEEIWCGSGKKCL